MDRGSLLVVRPSIAYLLWLDVLHSVLGLSADEPPPVAAQALQRVVQSVCPDGYDSVYPYLARMMSLPLDEQTDARLRDLPGDQLRASTFGAVEALTGCAASQRPLVLVCEDLHWGDATSLELLLRLFSLTAIADLCLPPAPGVRLLGTARGGRPRLSAQAH
jgi:hypothetical protein